MVHKSSHSRNLIDKSFFFKTFPLAILLCPEDKNGKFPCLHKPHPILRLSWNSLWPAINHSKLIAHARFWCCISMNSAGTENQETVPVRAVPCSCNGSSASATSKLGETLFVHNEPGIYSKHAVCFICKFHTMKWVCRGQKVSETEKLSLEFEEQFQILL